MVNCTPGGDRSGFIGGCPPRRDRGSGRLPDGGGFPGGPGAGDSVGSGCLGWWSRSVATEAADCERLCCSALDRSVVRGSRRRRLRRVPFVPECGQAGNVGAVWPVGARCLDEPGLLKQMGAIPDEPVRCGPVGYVSTRRPRWIGTDLRYGPQLALSLAFTRAPAPERRRPASPRRA